MTANSNVGVWLQFGYSFIPWCRVGCRAPHDYRNINQNNRAALLRFSAKDIFWALKRNNSSTTDFLLIKMNNHQTSVLTTLNSWMLRFFLYSFIGIGLMLINYDFRFDCQNCKNTISEAKKSMLDLSRGQYQFFSSFGILSDSLEDLAVGIKPDTNNYSYRILSPMKPAPTLNKIYSLNFHPQTAIFFATPKRNLSGFYQGETHIGLAFINNKNLQISICKSEKASLLFPTDFPTQPPQNFECPPGFSEVNFSSPRRLKNR